MDRNYLLLGASFLCCIVSAAVVYVFGANATLQNDIFWKDLSGNPIYSQGGGAIRVGNTYYWYGVEYTGAVTYYKDPTTKNNSIYAKSINNSASGTSTNKIFYCR